jgi:hypothetical protein
MYDIQKSLVALENDAIQHLQRVDVNTALRQLDLVFEALIQVPTKERRANSEFTRRAKVELDILLHQTNKLSAFVHSLRDHIGEPVQATSQRPHLTFIHRAATN